MFALTNVYICSLKILIDSLVSHLKSFPSFCVSPLLFFPTSPVSPSLTPTQSLSFSLLPISPLNCITVMVSLTVQHSQILSEIHWISNSTINSGSAEQRHPSKPALLKLDLFTCLKSDTSIMQSSIPAWYAQHTEIVTHYQIEERLHLLPPGDILF